MQKLFAPTPNGNDAHAENIARLKALFPELVTEGKQGASVNVDVLKQLVGDKTVTDADERYGLGWFGKREARKLALTPSLGTLRPAPEESVDWDTTKNLMIEGDNLEVLKLLQKSYAGKVKLIYIDPPYNTGKDFVYPDDFRDSIRNYQELTGQVEDGRKVSNNTESNGRFHSDWLNMMYPRLKIARELLHDEGLIFISIDDAESASLRKICDEIFGEENFRNEAVIRRGAKSVQSQFETWDKLGSGYERVMMYSKRADYRFPQQRRPLDDVRAGGWNNHWRGTDRATMRYPLLGITPKEGQWRWAKSRSDAAVSNYRKMLEDLGKTEESILQEEIDTYYSERSEEDLEFLRLSENGKPEHYLPPTDSRLLSDDWFDLPTGSSKEVVALFDRKKVFSNPKQTRLLERLLNFAPADAVIMDFFAGSGTTGHAVLSQNAEDNGKRAFVLVQIPEPLSPEDQSQKTAAEFCDTLGKPRTIAELTKERLRRAGLKITAENPEWKGDIGFRVFKLDSSNINVWNPNPEDVKQSLFDHTEHLKADRSELDILYEITLKRGLALCAPTETRAIAGKTVRALDGGALIACLSESISTEEAEALAQGILDWHKELAASYDTTCVFRDSAFADNVAKANLAAILEQNGIKNVRSL